MSYLKAKLVGGPYDGASDALTDLPEHVFIWECGNPRCPLGVHWSAPEQVGGPTDGHEAVRYDLMEDGPEDDGFYVYVYPQLAEPLAALGRTMALVA